MRQEAARGDQVAGDASSSSTPLMRCSRRGLRRALHTSRSTSQGRSLTLLALSVDREARPQGLAGRPRSARARPRRRAAAAAGEQRLGRQQAGLERLADALAGQRVGVPAASPATSRPGREKRAPASEQRSGAPLSSPSGVPPSISARAGGVHLGEGGEHLAQVHVAHRRRPSRARSVAVRDADADVEHAVAARKIQP
jgi:hypothetical protein